MSDGWIEMRTPLAASETVRVEIGENDTVHVVTDGLTLHLTRERCEELTTTLARALVRLHKLTAPPRRPRLRVVAGQAGPRTELDDPARE